MKRDPYNHKRRYLAWKMSTREGIPDLTVADSRLVLNFIGDMEVGRNIGRGTKKGPRGYARLNNLRHRLVFLAKQAEARYLLGGMTEVNDEQIHDLFGSMRSGALPRRDGRPYRSTGDYVKVFKAFWHWHMKVQRKRGVEIPDICLDLDPRTEKPPWVYLTYEQVQLLSQHAKHRYRVLMLFLFDSGIRSPTELVNVRVNDLSHDCSKLQIREETSKTFGRRINLLLCRDLLRSHINSHQLCGDDYVFPINPTVVNRYFKDLARRVLGDGRSPGGSCFPRLTLYDFRHSAACYWLARYKSESALKFRFGWKRGSMIEYYTHFLGMTDTITEDDLHIGEERTEMEKRLADAESCRTLLEERLEAMEGQMKRMLLVVRKVSDGADLPLSVEAALPHRSSPS